MSAEQTLYEVLGVRRDASPQQIRDAYRVLARRLHPDVNIEADAHSRFSAIASAYEILSDKTRRRSYDLTLRRTGDETAARAPAPGPAHYTWTNIGGDTFAGAEGRTELDDMYDAFFGGDDR